MTSRLSRLVESLTIVDKDAQQRRFPINSDFAWAQREFLAEVERQQSEQRPVRIICLKARQLGMSTVAEAVMYWWMFIIPRSNGLVIAHDTDTAQSLFEKSQTFWDTWPFRDLYHMKHLTQKRMTWEETRSTLRIATAKNVSTGRGRTLQAVHASECAYYPDPATLMRGLRQTIPNKPGTIFVLESTANGVGNWFHSTWQAAEAGDSNFVPLFFPYFRHPEYVMHTSLSTQLELTPLEREHMRLGASFENIQWYRWAFINQADHDEQTMMQEYPATSREAFIATGHNVFPLTKVEECFVPAQGYKGMLVGDENGKNARWVPDPSGSLTVFKKPTTRDRRADRYFISGDPSMTISGDRACIQVFNRATLEQVAVWHGRIDPINFGKEMMLLGWWYHGAELCPEVEGGGQATVATILNAGYPNVWQHRWADRAPGKVAMTYGWAMNWQRKNWCIGKLRYLIAENAVTFHDKETFNQLCNYVTYEAGDMGPVDQARGRDDAVTALAIGVTASMTEGQFFEHPTNAAVYDMFEQDSMAAVGAGDGL